MVTPSGIQPNEISVQWNDIDLYHAYRDFTADPVRFSADEVRRFVGGLVSCLVW